MSNFRRYGCAEFVGDGKELVFKCELGVEEHFDWRGENMEKDM